MLSPLRFKGGAVGLRIQRLFCSGFHLRQRFGCANLLTCGHLLEEFFKGSYKSCCRGCGFGFDVQTSDETLKTLHFELGSAIDVR